MIRNSQIKKTFFKFIDFLLTPITPVQEGRLQWNSEAGTLEIGMAGGDVALQIGQEMYLPRSKAIGSDILNGQVVYISGASGNNPHASLADATDPNKSRKTIAVATEDVSENQHGFFTAFGLVRGLNTNSFNAGDELFLDPLAIGGITNSEPGYEHEKIKIGYCIKKHSTEGIIFVHISNEKNDQLHKITEEPTGFYQPRNITVEYNKLTRKIKLTGTVAAFYQGKKIAELVSGWESAAHDVGANKLFFLFYDPTNGIHWSETVWNFTELMIAAVSTQSGNERGYREVHSLMDSRCHFSNHNNIGTYRYSGGTLGDYVLNSTVAANRRPSISETVIYDEDLPSVLAALVSGGPYTQFYLSGAGVDNYNTAASDIVPLNTNNPYYNLFSGGAWSQALVSNNYHTSIWVLAVPVTADSDSQKYRFLFIQGQKQNLLFSDEKALTTNSVNLGNIQNFTKEFNFIARIIIQFTAANWKLIEIESLTGSRQNQVASPQGNFLSVVATNSTLTGNGTVSDPLGVAGGASGSFASNDGKTITVTDGVITSIV